MSGSYPTTRPRITDAQLTVGVVVATDVALVLFVLLPERNPDLPLPAGLDALWMLGAVATVFLGPVAAGLAAYAGASALVLHGRTLGASERRSSLLTLALAAVFLIGLALAWGADGLVWFGD
ncbi:hypothetical protein GON03_21425 [Nocardioides sp. MAH-18]|uniref:Uncharacterized protein n=1 Tax=Nocardioides agri TaxID=2682843 RepID=A0A6L6XYL2_9ACTN|nr:MULTISPECIES: hypothetical protein [unclassified Nocardioides]MBA2952585.1 hypothetical protein [Nocardioides sp. CGMCC 1.13656]MVQ51747.1 hypothetical protein [Nocardioides sp. MAH-18]